MLLHLKKGAVINFMVEGNTSYITWGAVREINENEVVFSRQEFVGDSTVKEHGHQVNGEQIDQFVTVDYGNPIHIDKKKIFGWNYHSIFFDGRTSLSDCVLQSELKDYSKESIHYYDSNHICVGEGDDLE